MANKTALNLHKLYLLSSRVFIRRVVAISSQLYLFLIEKSDTLQLGQFLVLLPERKLESICLLSRLNKYKIMYRN